MSKFTSRLFHAATKYAITPPIFPPGPLRVWAGVTKYCYSPNPQALTWRTALPRKCIACGRIHVTSEDCPIPEPPEVVERGVHTRPDNGYKLLQAAGMGCFDDV